LLFELSVFVYRVEQIGLNSFTKGRKSIKFFGLAYALAKGFLRADQLTKEMPSLDGQPTLIKNLFCLLHVAQKSQPSNLTNLKQ